nr:substrate-binding domain-containing protein [Candidatus Sigynarchaeota archaeon]
IYRLSTVISMERKLTAIIVIGIIGASIGVTATLAVLLYPVPRLKLSTTTSTENSGLLEYLIDDFEARYNVIVDVSAKGTGASINDAKEGNADFILVHARSSELDFVNQGYGYRRACFMYNDFVLVGPTTDPSNVSGTCPTNITRTFEVCASNCTTTNPFVSRGDGSGTHIKEKEIWNQTSAGAPPDPLVDLWYDEVGSGMGTTLSITNEKLGYTIADRGTWISMEATLANLTILVENDPSGLLMNPYSFILVNKTLHPHVNQALAEKFIAFCLSDYGLAKINNFTMNSKQLFFTHWNTNPAQEGLQSDPSDITFWNSKIVEFGMNNIGTSSIL